MQLASSVLMATVISINYDPSAEVSLAVKCQRKYQSASSMAVGEMKMKCILIYQCQLIICEIINGQLIAIMKKPVWLRNVIML